MAGICQKTSTPYSITVKTETFHFELLTPCFCGGAEPEKRAEIRASSIRGQLRWWFRALGGIKADEDRIFGSVAGQDAGTSKLMLRVRTGVASNIPKNLEDYTGKNGNKALQDPESYFLWPLRPYERHGIRYEQKRGCLEPIRGERAVRFDLVVTFLPQLLPKDIDSIRSLICVWSILGSLGTRSLKGYGSVWPKRESPITVAELRLLVRPMPENSVYLWQTGFENAREALAWVATEYKKLRCGTNRYRPLRASHWGQNDHDAADRFAHNRPTSVYRPVFGLPLKQSFRPNPPHRPQGFDVFTEWHGVDRYASPLHIKIGLLDSGYCVILVFFDQRALRHGDLVTLRDGGHHRTVTIDRGLWDHMKTLGVPLR